MPKQWLYGEAPGESLKSVGQAHESSAAASRSACLPSSLWDSPWKQRRNSLSLLLSGSVAFPLFGQEGEETITDDFDSLFHAWPETDFRVFGKLKSTYRSALPGTWERDLKVFEPFSDFQFGDRIFFRMSKHTIRWGAGYFFSPADVLNLVSIEPEDPEAEREGPISLKIQVPFGAHNLHRAMVTLTGSIWDIDLLGKGVLQWGSDRTCVRSAALPPSCETYRLEEELFFSATVGASYLNADWQLALYARYYYNGLGYEDFLAADLAAAALAQVCHFGAEITDSRTPLEA